MSDLPTLSLDPGTITPISVIILTHQEEANIRECVASVLALGDVHVVDSGSTDRTAEVAQEVGARVAAHPFRSFGDQRNWALDTLPLAHDWVLFLDADEVATPAFREELIARVTSATPETAGFYCCWKMLLEGQWLKRCDNFPKWQLRVVRRGRARFTDAGHGQKEGEIDGVLRYVTEPYLHFAFSKGWSAWIERHNRYSTLEAESRSGPVPPLAAVWARDGSRRNAALKGRVSRIPGWPLIRFIHAYLFRLGFLEGKPGLIYCVNMAYYEFLIQIKMRERQCKELPITGEAHSYLAPILFVMALVSIFYFALVPNHNNMFSWMPYSAGRWLSTHDDFNNVTAFALFATIGFGLKTRLTKARRFWQRWKLDRLFLFLALVAAFEIAQRWIPGRHSGIRDVYTGSAGVMLAWTIYVIRSQWRLFRQGGGDKAAHRKPAEGDPAAS